MKSKHLFFFADTSDLEPILTKFEDKINVHYFQTGMFDNYLTPTFSSIFENKNLGRVSNGDWNLNDNYLILRKEQSLNMRSIPQKNGGVKYSVDQMQNLYSIVLNLGGVYKEGVLVAGSVGTIHGNEVSQNLFKELSSIIKKGFSIKVGNFYVGTSAKNKMDSGWRLVTNEKSPKEYDLTENVK